MCGLCGIVAPPGMPVDRQILREMLGTMAHRGPDGYGEHVQDNVGLGHRRLAIIDIEGGSQPMPNEDRSCWIVYNGEVFNYPELHETYLQGRYRFATRSDTEVILHMYEEFGEECVRYLNGMFAFALWDQRSRKLFMARDRLGVKPLYYAVRGGTLLFGSEVKSLLKHPLIGRVSVDKRAVDEFVTYGYVQTPRTIFSGIFRVPEGHTLTWQEGEVRIRPYWDLSFESRPNATEESYIEGLMDLLADSVRIRLRSDVPVGVLLSGGIDSSIVAKLAAQTAGRLSTFSIGYDAGDSYNELHYARRIAQAIGADHHEMILSPDTFKDFIPRYVQLMDEPVSEDAAISLYFVSEMASRHVKVVLSGEGSDEIFAGYAIYGRMQRIARWAPILQHLAWTAGRYPVRDAWSGRLSKYLHLAGEPLERRYLNVRLYDIRLRRTLYSTEFAESLQSDPLEPLLQLTQKTRSWPLLSRMLYLDTKTWLPNDLLIKADRMTMGVSIELRVPFLDYRLVEYAARIPPLMKLRNGATKYILKKAVRGMVPDEIIDRSKMGFPTPLARMFRGELSDYLRDTILDARATGRGYFSPAIVRRLVDEHLEGKADNYSALWRILLLEEWHRRYIDDASGLVRGFAA
jgi:asparagine synthase (glutamine-hydrolysing)